MIPRKHSHSTTDHHDLPWTTTHNPNYTKTSKSTTTLNVISSPYLKYTLFITLSVSVWFLILSCFTLSPSKTNTHLQKPHHSRNNLVNQEPMKLKPTCDSKVKVFIYDLPKEFNLGLLQDCTHLNIYTNMCPHVENNGLGQPFGGGVNDGDSNNPTWFATHQFIAEMIFHARVENHPCRSWDPSQANLFYIPFYGGLHASSKFREMNITARDELAVRLLDFVENQRWWKRSQGRDHFISLGRTAWDFLRNDKAPDFGANCLLNMPSVKNMSVLTVERNPWWGQNLYGIPYPSYFHPLDRNQMVTWQDRVRSKERPHLFSFIGAPRKGVEKAAIREELIRQCNESSRCNLVKCGRGASMCHQPYSVLEVMTQSEFCLQAPGDSFTRRSTFDSILAGCIPVFFSEHTAYTQYAWYLPEDPSEYSVFMDFKESVNGTLNIEKELVKIGKERTEKMRQRVIELIPKVTYVHPNSSDVGFRDAVDVALEALVDQVSSFA